MCLEISVVYEVSEYQTHHPAVVVFLCIVYAVLSLVAFTGNALVIWIIRELVEGEIIILSCDNDEDMQMGRNQE